MWIIWYVAMMASLRAMGLAPLAGAEISALAPPIRATPGRRRGAPAAPPARVRAKPRARSRANFRTAARDRRSAPASVRAIRRCARARRHPARRPARKGLPLVAIDFSTLFWHHLSYPCLYPPASPMNLFAIRGVLYLLRLRFRGNWPTTTEIHNGPRAVA